MKPHRGPLVIAAAVAAMILLVLSGPYRSGPRSTFDLSALSPDDRLLLSDLVLNIAEAPEETLPQAREAAWALFRRHGTPSAEARRGLETVFLRIGQGPRLFWLDAQRALEEARPVKSAARTQWEAELMGEGWLSMEQQRRYDLFMERIARGEPVESTHGAEMLVDAPIVEEIVKSWDDGELRRALTLLLTPL